MSKIQFKKNADFLTSWASAVGKLIINFSGIELETYQWLIQMTVDTEHVYDFEYMVFSKRVNEIEKCVRERAFSEKWRVTALKKWNEARILSRFRNRIAHNPIMFSWIDPREKGEPDFIGVIDMQKKGQLEREDEDLLPKSRIEKARDEAANLAVDLESLREEWCSVRDRRLIGRDRLSRGLSVEFQGHDT